MMLEKESFWPFIWLKNCHSMRKSARAPIYARTNTHRWMFRNSYALTRQNQNANKDKDVVSKRKVAIFQAAIEIPDECFIRPVLNLKHYQNKGCFLLWPRMPQEALEAGSFLLLGKTTNYMVTWWMLLRCTAHATARTAEPVLGKNKKTYFFSFVRSRA